MLQQEVVISVDVLAERALQPFAASHTPELTPAGRRIKRVV